MSFEEASTIPTGGGGLNALHFIRRAKLELGDKILITGAAGSIGTYAVQLAKHFGATVTAVDTAEKFDMLRSIGADHVIDFREEDFTLVGETYDVVFDIVGWYSFSRCLKSVKPGGRYILANPQFLHMFRAAWVTRISNKTVIFEFAGENADDIVLIKKLIEAGEIRAVIDRRFPLEQTRAAHHYVDSGQKSGNVIITVLPEPES
jgi:NADPH:quinone reductase-like Zn-dependent oxidoreductase